MSFAEKRKRREKRESIIHKTKATLFTSMLAAGLSAWALAELVLLAGFEMGLIFRIALFIGVSYGLSHLASIALSRKYTSQITKITDEARAISVSRNLQRRIPVSEHPDELSHLESTLNEMLSRLEESFERERRFVSDASHELRTPVAVMKGYLDIVRGWGREDSKLMDESLLAMAEETDRMGRLIDGLLKLARMDRDDLEMKLGAVGSGALIGKMLDGVGKVQKGRKVQTGEIQNFKVKADADLLLECLRALFENAVNYTPEGGEITLSAKTKDGFGRFSVKDNGMGISKSDISQIFDRFSRTEASRKINPSGSGLGLSLVKSIIEAQNGFIEVESDEGKGSVFTVGVPLA